MPRCELSGASLPASLRVLLIAELSRDGLHVLAHEPFARKDRLVLAPLLARTSWNALDLRIHVDVAEVRDREPPRLRRNL